MKTPKQMSRIGGRYRFAPLVILVLLTLRCVHPVMAFKTNVVELGHESVYDNKTRITRNAGGQMLFDDDDLTTYVTLLSLTQGVAAHGELSGLTTDDHAHYLNTSRHNTNHSASYNALLSVPLDAGGNRELGAHLLDRNIHVDRTTDTVEVTGDWTFSGTPAARAGLTFGPAGDNALVEWDQTDSILSLNRRLRVSDNTDGMCRMELQDTGYNSGYIQMNSSGAINLFDISTTTDAGDESWITINKLTDTTGAGGLRIYPPGLDTINYADLTCDGNGLFSVESGNLRVVNNSIAVLELEDKGYNIGKVSMNASGVNNYLDIYTTSDAGDNTFLAMNRLTNTTGTVEFRVYPGNGSSTYYCAMSSDANGDLTIDPSGGDVHIDGDLGVGVSAPGYKLEVATSVANYAASIFNDGGATTRQGLRIQCGEDAPSGATTVIGVFDGNGTLEGGIENNAGTIQIFNASDARLKEDIAATAKDGVEILNDLQVSDFRFKGREKQHTGFVAQDLERVLPDAVTTKSYTRQATAADRDLEGYSTRTRIAWDGHTSSTEVVHEISREFRAIRPMMLIPLLVKATQQQQSEIDSLWMAIEALAIAVVALLAWAAGGALPPRTLLEKIQTLARKASDKMK